MDAGETGMPMIRVELLDGRTVEQKREFAAAVTQEAVRVLRCPAEAVDVVFVDVRHHDWATGGRLASDPQD